MDKRMTCFHCLMQETAELRIDKKGRPYTMCRWCNTRSFMSTREALWGIVIFEPKLQDLYGTQSRDDLLQRVLAAGHPLYAPADTLT
jgi:hypothetical protein